MFTLAILVSLAMSIIIAVGVVNAIDNAIIDRRNRAECRRLDREALPLWMTLRALDVRDSGNIPDRAPTREWRTMPERLTERLMGARVALRWFVACSPALRALRRPVRRFAAPVAATVALSLALGACAVAPLAGDEVRQTVKALVVRGITAARAAKEMR